MSFNQAFQAQFFLLLQKSSSLTERECFALWAIITTLVDTRSFSFSEVSRRFGRRVGRNFLTQTLKKYAYLQRQVIGTFIQMLLANLSPQTRVYLLGDDTLVNKTGQQIFGAFRWYDHTQGRRVQAICLVTLALVVQDQVLLVFPWVLADRPPSPSNRGRSQKEQDRKTASLIEMLTTVVHQCQASGIAKSSITVLADSWFSSRPMLDWVRQSQLVFRIDGKKSYLVQCPDHEARTKAKLQKRGRRRKYFVKYRRIESYLGAPTMWAYTTEPETGRRIYWKKAVVTLKTTGRVTVYGFWREGSRHPKFILANARYHRPSDSRTVYRDYRKRWLIERAHKDLKQHFGLSHCQARDPWTVVGFFGLVTFAYAVLRLTVFQTEQSNQMPWTCPKWADNFHKEHIQALRKHFL